MHAVPLTGGVVDMLAHRLAGLDESEGKMFQKLFGAKAGENASIDDVEKRLIDEKAQEMKVRYVLLTCIQPA